jgi:CHAT domain-containing protein
LLLDDRATAPLTVTELMSLELRHPQLAYLSACETAVNANIQLLDEPIHLASAFHLAGFPRVVGTLWAISDSIAARVSQDFYDTVLAAGSGFDDSAIALHHAVLEARKAARSMPSIWASFIHLGA